MDAITKKNLRERVDEEGGLKYESEKRNPVGCGSGTCLRKYRGRIDGVFMPLLARNFDDWLTFFRRHASAI